MSAAAGACAGQSVLPPPEPPAALQSGADALPADLDVAVRLDLAAIRRAFGDDVGRSMVTAAARRGRATVLDSDLLDAADVAWIGIRPVGGAVADHVIVLEGPFSAFEPLPKSAWTARDLGAAWRHFERDSTARGQIMTIYQSPSVLVMGTVAEADALESRVERRETASGLAPPTRGLLSLSVRLRALREQLDGTLGRLAARAELLEGSVTWDDGALGARLSVAYPDSVIAGRNAGELEGFRGRLAKESSLVGAVARGAGIAQVESSVTVEVALTAQLTVRVLDCAVASRCR